MNGQYREEKRFLLEVRQRAKKKYRFLGVALNDMVLSRGNETHLIEYDVSINKQFVGHYRADGLIIATPTGSTAYAMSAGGPIMHPDLNAVVMVPMFSHSLSNRPLVVDGDSTIDIKASKHNELDLHMSCDGQEFHCIKPGDEVLIKKIKAKLHLLHPLDYHYYDTLRIKLGWGYKPEE